MGFIALQKNHDSSALLCEIGFVGTIYISIIKKIDPLKFLLVTIYCVTLFRTALKEPMKFKGNCFHC